MYPTVYFYLCCVSVFPPFAFFTSKIIALLVALPSLYVLTLCYHIQYARASGIQYVVVPFHSYNFQWVYLISRPLLNIFNRFTNYQIANSTITSRRRLVDGLWPVRLRYAPFEQLGDTFLIVASGGIIFNTADAAVITSIINRPLDFPKAVHLYKRIAIYGQNVVSAGGAMWRRHRKLTSPAFAEANNRLVWETTLQCTKAMTTSWIQSNELGQRNIQQLRDAAMDLSLEVIGIAALGQNVGWVKDDSERSDRTLPGGHTMAFAASLKHVCANIVPIVRLLSPFVRFIKFVLPKSPADRRNIEAYENWRDYMKDMVVAKKHSIASDNGSFTFDIISHLLKGQGIREGDQEPPLSNEEVIGNLFLFVIAGHETSASSILLCILLLALHPTSQQAVQRDLDEVLNGRSLSKLDYDHDLPRLLDGRLGAVLNEQLRLQSPAPSIPKMVTSEQQPILVGDKQVVLPPNTIIRICEQGVHMNPKYWPFGSPEDINNPAFEHNNGWNDLGEFKPERWATREGPNNFKPRPGSFLPFSLGQRSCLGKRFAQIEIVAALAVIFSQFSVELDLSAVASDSELDKMSKKEKYQMWKAAEGEAQKEWRTKVTCILTVQLTKDAKIPLRLVKRGEERFFDLK